MNRRILIPLLLIASLLFAFAGPVGAQYAPTCTIDLVSSPNTVSGDGFHPGATITLVLTNEFLPDGTPVNPAPSSALNVQLATPTADADGTWTTPVILPGDLDGNYFFVASGDAYSDTYDIDTPHIVRNLGCQFEVEVEAELAFTGAESATLAKYGLGILAAGGLVLFAANRRKEAVTD